MRRYLLITFILISSVASFVYFGCSNGDNPSIPDPASIARYISADLCAACHTGEGAEWEMTAHYRALEDLVQSGQSVASCLECHTTGYDGNAQNSGYDDPDEIVSVRFDGVQCESCHGAGSNHVADRDPVIAGLDSELCGGCHDNHYRLYTEWEASAHAHSIDRRDTDAEFTVECLGCHSADYIFAEDIPDNATTDEFDLSLTCVVCHDPHNDTYEFQLRGDRSTLCYQCHTSGAIPGQEIQYPQADLFLGTGGYKYPGQSYSNTAHSTIDETCIACHMWKNPYTGYGADENAVSGHTFEFRIEACRECHPGLDPIGVTGVQSGIQEVLDELKAELDAATDNDKLTQSYLYAKFNYDFIIADGSTGMHNSRYARALIEDSIDDFEPGS